MVVSSSVVVFGAFGGGLINLLLVLEQRPAGWRGMLDIALGALACLLLLWRLRAPVTIAAVLAGLSAVAACAGVANYVALFTVARHRRPEVAGVVAALNVIAAVAFWLQCPDNSSVSLTVVVNVSIAFGVVAWGVLQQTQHDLVEVYRDRAARIEREQGLLAERVQMAERTRISRDMHDSVAHHISLIALYAGGLEVANGRSPETVSQTAGTIRTTATRALDELRSVIGILREGGVVGVAPPGGGGVDELIAAARAAGQTVVAHVDTESSTVEGAYRVVREGLTNARKHAPGALVTVDIWRSGDDVWVSVVNPVVPGAPRAPAGGAGLTGLAEAIEACGGDVEHGIRHPDGAPSDLIGEFFLRGRLRHR